MLNRFLRSLLTDRGQSARSERSKRRNRRTAALTELLEPRALLSAAVVADGGFENPVQPNNNWEQANGTGGGSLVGSLWTITGGAGITRNISAFQNGGIPAPEGVQHGLIQGNGSFSQTVTGFVVGGDYELSLLTMARQSGNFGSDLEVILDQGLATETSLVDIPEVNFSSFTEVVSPTFVATKSSYTLTISSDNNEGALTGDRTTFFDDVALGSVQTPFVARTVSDGTRIEAEDFDSGGAGIAYVDTTAGNAGGAYRTDQDVDIQATSDVGGGHTIGWIADGESLEYIADVVAGNYDVDIRVAAASAGASIRLLVSDNPDTGFIELGTAAIPDTGGVQTWTTITLEHVDLAGWLGQDRVFRLEMIGGGFNLNWFEFAQTFPNTTATAAIQSGNWNDPATWDKGVPDADIRALVRPGVTVTLDGTDHAAKELVVHGVLNVAEDGSNRTLTSRWIHVNSGGVFQAGTNADRFDNGEFIVTLTGTDQEADHVIETATGTMNVSDNDGFLMTAMNGRLQFFGEDKVTFTKLAATVEAGRDTITVENIIERNFDGTTSAASDGELNWEVGDEIVIASSSYDYNDEEVRTITAVNNTGTETTVTLDAALNHRHYGEIETYGNGTRTWDIDLRAEVALLSRSITIQGTQDTDAAFGDRANYGTEAGQNLGVGAHAMFMPGSGQITIDGARFDKMGQTATLGRYPIHWHVAGDRTGDILRNASITNSNNRGVTIHGTQGVLVEGNVLHDVHGHGFFMEDAAETDNQFLHNITFGIHKVGGGFTSTDPFVVPGITRGGDGKVNGEAPQGENGEGSHDTGQNPPQRFVHSAAYWITNPDNTWVGNIAAGSEGTGFWFILPETVLGLSKDTGLYNGMNPMRTNLLQFDNNTAHSSQVGLTFDRGEDISGRASSNAFQPPQTMQINNLTAYKNHGTAVYHRAVVGIFNESRFADNFHSSFNTFNQEEHNILFVGHSRGNAEPETLVGGYRLYDGPGRILNSHFAGFSADNAHAFRIEGGANKFSHTQAQGISFEHDGTADTLGIELYGNAFFSVDNSPEFVAGRPDALSGLVYDVDGSLTGHGGGGAGYVLTPKVDFYRDSTDVAPVGWNGYLSDDRFAQLKLGRIADVDGDYIPPFRISNGDGHSIVADRWNLTYVQRMYTKVNAGDYTIEFLSGIPADGFDINLDIKTVSQSGDATVFRFVDVGKSYKPNQGTEVTSLDALRAAGNTSWFRAADGDLWMKLRESGATIRVQPTAPRIVTNNNDSGAGSLRAAIDAANTNAGFDTIIFDIGADGSTHTIQPQTPLPVITDRVYIDGSTQAALPVAHSGFESPVQPDNDWELANGSGNGNLTGSQWTFTGGAGIARNLSAFQQSSVPTGTGRVPTPAGEQFGLIQSSGSFNQTVSGFEIGQTYDLSLLAMGRQSGNLGGDLKAVLDAGEATEATIVSIPEVMFTRFTEVNSTSFVATKTSYTLTILSEQSIGDTFIDDVTFRSLSAPITINGSAAGGSAGLELAAPGTVHHLTINGFAAGAGILLTAPGSVVDGVLSGIAGNGTPVPNQYGVQIESDGNTVYSSVLAGNTLAGIHVAGADNNVISGNWIGTELSGTVAIANGSNGIELGTSNGTTITDNVIAFNTEDGVVVAGPSTGNTISNNSIFDNGQLGIDLGNDGVTVNDNLDVDTGANDLTNTPVLTGVAAVPVPAHILFQDNFDDGVSTSIDDPSARATGLLADLVKYDITNADAGEVAVTNGLLDWTGTTIANGNLETNNGKQNWTFRTGVGGTTHFDWAPYLAGDIYEVSFTYRSAWSQPLTFGISDSPQLGHWNADITGSYDYAFGAWGSRWDSGEDGNTTRSNGGGGNTEFDVLLKINEPAGTAAAWVDGTLIVTESIDFESPGRYFSFGEPNSYGGYIDDFRVFVTPTGWSTTFDGEMNGLANTQYTLEFFANAQLDSAGHGEGQTMVHTMTTTTDGSGTASFSFDLTTLSPGTFITGTATDPSGDTSEFSLGAEVVEGAADLVATAFNAISDHVLLGQTDVTFTVANTGSSAAAAFDAHVVWSANDVLGDGDDMVVSGSIETFAGLAAGASETRSTSLQLDEAALYAHAFAMDSAGQPVGTESLDTSRLFLVIDINNDVFETNETNNSGQGHLIDRDDITYFPWDTNGNGAVTPVEALAAIQAINTTDTAHDFDGNGIVTPLEALSVLQRIGYVRNDSVIGDAPASLASAGPVPTGQSSAVSALGRWEPDLTGVDNHAFPAFSCPADDEEEDSFFTVEPSESPAVVPTASASASDTVSDTFRTTEWLDVI